MLRRTAKTIVATAGIVGVLGAGVAVAADPPTCPYGNTPQATQTQTQTPSGAQQQLRKRDGTGPRHAQRLQQRDGASQASRHGGRHGGSAYQATGNPNCPYRS
jgi:hypothetical protein